jgi:hypothetical protein
LGDLILVVSENVLGVAGGWKERGGEPSLRIRRGEEGSPGDGSLREGACYEDLQLLVMYSEIFSCQAFTKGEEIHRSFTDSAEGVWSVNLEAKGCEQDAPKFLELGEVLEVVVERSSRDRSNNRPFGVCNDRQVEVIDPVDAVEVALLPGLDEFRLELKGEIVGRESLSLTVGVNIEDRASQQVSYIVTQGGDFAQSL